MIPEMSSCPQVLCIRGCWQDHIRSRIISTRWLPKCHHAHSCYVKNRCIGQRYRKITEQGASLNSVIVTDAYAHRTGLGQVANGSRQHNQWKAKKWDVGITMVNEKRGIAAGRVRIVDYVSSRISAKVSCSLARPSPDSSSVCANSLRLLSAPHKYHRRK